MSKKSSKQTTQTTPWAPGQPYILGAANTIQNTVNQHQPQLDSMTNDMMGRLPGMWNQAQDTSTIQPGLNYAGDVLGGKYLNPNQYTINMANMAANDAANHVNSTYSMAGRTGSGAAQTNLAKGVDLAQNQVLFQNYQNERNNQTAVAGLMPSLNNAKYAGYTPALAATQLAGQLPFYGTQSLSAMGGLLSPYTNQDTKTTPSTISNILNYMQAAASAASAAAGA